MAPPRSSQPPEEDVRCLKQPRMFHPSQALSPTDFNARRPRYVLKGFNQPILKARRKIPFFNRLSTSRVCEMCATVPARVIPLPCGHVACHGCVSHAFQRCRDSSHRPVCPRHRVPLANSNIRVVENSRHLLQKTVLCVNFHLGCLHKMKLEQLQKHCDEECNFPPVPCELCEQVIPKCKMAEHHQQCARRDPADEH
ncbi:hypothetical protein MTO96_046242 [Rhipicephalus appendiculatus]